MRSLLLAAFLPALLGAAPDALQIINPVISSADDGVNEPAGTQHIGGDTLFFSCRISNYTKSPEQRVQLSYSVQAFDPKGVALVELYKNDIAEEVAPQDKEWLPRVATEIAIPPAVLAGKYKIVVKVEDVIGHATASLEAPFQVRGRALSPSDKLAVQNIRFFHGEEDTKSLDKPVYKAGDSLWVRFDVTGYRYGQNNLVDLSYVFSVLASDGSALWTAQEPILDQGESFYPKPYVSGAFSIKVQTAVKPGEYAIGVKAMDAVGKQTIQAKGSFSVQ
jgi:hypothetical protein